MFIYLVIILGRVFKGYLYILNVGFIMFIYDGLLLKFYMSKNLVVSDLYV